MGAMTNCPRAAGHFSVGAPRVLVVEDSETIREMVGEALTDVGYHTVGRSDGNGLEEALDGLRPDLVVLDVMLPGRDGFDLIDVICDWGDVGIVLITARDGLDDRLRGLDGGADDYVIKPFELAELVSRVGAVLRRRGRLPQVVQLGDLMLDAEAGVAARNGRRLDLTATELRLLAFLVEQRGRIVSAGQILNAVWGYDAYDPNLLQGVAALVVVALLLVAVSRVALRPLDRLTALANDIRTGDRGRRLRPDPADTELGRAAVAFDGMLDALEASERRAQRAADAAQRAETATRRFLVDAAHELRTPIAGIQVAAEQLANSASQQQGDDGAGAQYRRASLLLSDARRAGRLVSDMLDLSRIDAGLPLDTQDVDLAAIADAEADRAAMLAPQLTVRRTGLAELNVNADPTRLAQILSNLLDNARRYTPPGGAITIDVCLHEGAAEVTVTDSGPGIPDDERKRIFERLVRLDAGRARDHGGAGLGLPIARALARAHGGELVCVPHDGGAQFRLRLPVPPGE
jgi:signal transduction histidine kinase